MSVLRGIGLALVAASNRMNACSTVLGASRCQKRCCYARHLVPCSKLPGAAAPAPCDDRRALSLLRAQDYMPS
jgi:hypothetical protein